MTTDLDILDLELVVANQTPPISLVMNSPEKFLFETEGNIVLAGEGRPEVMVGEWRVFYADLEAALNAGIAPFDVLDSRAETAGYLPLYDEDDELRPSVAAATSEAVMFSQNLLMLDWVVVYPEFRNRNIGLAALSTLMQRFSAGAGLVVLRPFPLQFQAPNRRGKTAARKPMGLNAFPTDKTIATRQLARYYAKLGFRRVKGTDILAFDLSCVYPSAETLLMTPGKRRNAQRAATERKTARHKVSPFES
jgi:GNAT superfamily N-acetyltransferase